MIEAGVVAGIDDPGRRPATGRPQDVDPARPRIATVYDYLIGGKNHLARDRWVGDRLVAAGSAALRAREDRWFLGRVVRYPAAQTGIRQFLDIGTGYPVTGGGNVHEIAQAIQTSREIKREGPAG